MSMFRKPKKIQRRVFCADDEEEGDPEPPPPPVISEKKENRPIKSTPLLSFVDEEEEDGEVFKVKKSSQSKRLAKRREKEKRKATDGDNNHYDNYSYEDKTNPVEDQDIEEQEKPKPKKKVTLEGLILSGREALAADGAGDISDESQHEEDEEDSRGFHRYRPETVRAALAVAPGHIPDAALIHAARKTRQKARELGGDYIPIQAEAKPGSRLVRDDGSADEEDEEGRLHVRGLELPSDKPKRGTAAAPTNEELDSEVDEWEEQQIKKAMPAIPDISGEGGVEMNPFAAPPPPPPRLAEAPAHLRPLPAPLVSASDLVQALADRLEELKSSRGDTERKRAAAGERLARAARARAARAARRAALDRAYRRAQAARGFLTDLVECLDEKMPQLEALEARALALHRRRCEFLLERRRADVRDQAHDVLAAPAAPGAPAATGRAGAGARAGDDEAKVRRAAEREGRRRARRLRREAAATAAAHRDGDSSDDDLPPAELHHYAREREAIQAGQAALFEDALPSWRSVRGVCARLAKFRARAPTLYADAYLADYLPRLLAPYVRHQLILWNPLADEDNEDYEKMDWYKCLMMYGVRSGKPPGESDESSSEESEEEAAGEARVSERAVREDMDLLLVPTLVSKVVLPKVTELVEQAWDPMCVRATVRVRRAAVRAAAVPGAALGTGASGGGGGGAPLRALAAAAAARLAAAHAADVFLPPLPHHVLEAGGAGAAFWRRCLGAGVRLLRAALALTAPPALLRADRLVLAIVETLCSAAGAATGAFAASACAALAETLPRAGALRAAALRRLARLAALALARLPPADPPHRKAQEQMKNILAEVRAVE